MNFSSSFSTSFRSCTWLRAVRNLAFALKICLTCAFLPLQVYSPFVALNYGVVLAQSATHVVGVGETLSLIAQTYQISQADLMRINGIQNANAIYVGQELLLPGPTEDQSTPEPPPSDSGEAPLLPSASHTVQRGETLRSIADAVGVDIVELMTTNFIRDADAIYVGQVLELPAQSDAPGSSVNERADVMPEETALPADEADNFSGQTSNDEEIRSHEDEVRDGENSVINGDTTAPDLEETPEDAEDVSQPDADSKATTGTELDTEPVARTTTLNQIYTVQPGDTLGRVALQTGVSPEALLALNRMNNFDALAPGQMLILPATFEELQVVDVTGNPESSSPTEPDLNIHTVQPGETLNLIAQAYDVTLSELMTANLLRNPDMVSIGQALRIPDPVALASAAEQEADAKSAEEEAKPANALPEISLPRRGYYFYTVQPGDTTAKISLQFDSTPLAIKEYNGLPSEETVYMGLELQIPYGPPPLPGSRPRTPVSGTSFVVSLSRQQCWVMRGERVLYDWICSTGYGQWTTRTGSFAVQTRQEMAKSYAYSLDMPYWLGIYDVGSYENGIHGLPIRWDNGEKIWEGLIGRPATYGCAMLDDIQAEQLFNLAFLGMPVHIVD